MEKDNNSVYYYEIHVSYEIPYNILEDSSDPNVLKAKEELYKRLADIIPAKYEKFSIKIVIYQLEDTLNYLVNYNSFFRSKEGLPMEEYMSAKEVKEAVEKEFEDFFDLVDCEYRRINIIKLLSNE